MAYTDTATLKRYLGIGVTDDDTLLGELITRSQAIIDHYTGRTFEASSDSTRYFDAVRDVDGLTLHLDADLCAVTSVTNGDGTTVTSSQYTTEPRNATPYHQLKMLSNTGLMWTYTTNHENAISVTGKWAYSTTAPADIVAACVRLAAYLYRQKDSSTFETTAYPDAGIIETPSGMPKDVRQMLAYYRRRTL